MTKEMKKVQKNSYSGATTSPDVVLLYKKRSSSNLKSTFHKQTPTTKGDSND